MLIHGYVKNVIKNYLVAFSVDQWLLEQTRKMIHSDLSGNTDTIWVEHWVKNASGVRTLDSH